MNNRVSLRVSYFLLFSGSMLATAQTIDLPTSKQLIEEIPGHPQRLNSLPVSMAISPDRRYVVTVNAGYGTFESKYDQSLAVLDTQTGTLADFPISVRKLEAPSKRSIQAWPSAATAGTSTPAWVRSPTPPAKAGRHRQRHRGLQFESARSTPERFITLPLQQLAPGRKTRLIDERDGDKASLSRRHRRGWCSPARNSSLSPTIFPTTFCWSIRRAGRSSSASIFPRATPCPARIPSPSRLQPTASAPLLRCGTPPRSSSSISPQGPSAASWRFSSPITQPAPGTHPCAFAFSPDGKTLYVALANRDAVAAVNIAAGQFTVKGYLRYATARPELLRRRAGGPGPQRRRQPPLRRQHGQRFRRRHGHSQAHRQSRKSRAWSSPSASSPPSGCPSPWRPRQRQSSTSPPTRAKAPARTICPRPRPRR